MATKRVLFLLCALLLLAALPAQAEQKPIILTTSLSPAMAGVHYGTRIEAQGEHPMVFHLVAGEGLANVFPQGMKLSENGGLYGAPAYPGLYEFQVRVTNPAGSSYINYALRVEPYDESKLRTGGEDFSLLGEGNDPLTGVANAINGGRATMQANTIYFVDRKGFLYETPAPYDKKPRKLFSARAYAHLDSNPTTLYYYHRYLDSEATKRLGENIFVTRIAQDPIVGKGRNTLFSLNWEDFSSLSITNEVLVYIGYGHVMGRIKLENKGHAELRMYHAGRQIMADMVIPYNGHVYFREPETGWLYRAPLDGQLAQPVVTQRVNAFTPARLEETVRLYCTGEDGQVFSVTLDGQDLRPIHGLRAGTLNAGEQALFYTDLNHKHRLMMLTAGDPADATQLSDFGVDQVYVFDTAVVCQKRRSKELWVLTPGGETPPVRIVK